MWKIIKTLCDCVLPLIFLTNCCFAEADNSQEANCEKFLRKFFYLPQKSQIEEFRKYDLEMKFDVYVCGNQFVEPPTMHLAGEFAKEGAVAVGFLKEKILATKEDLVIRDILLILEQMSISGAYDVAGDVGLMGIINQAVEQVRDPFWKKLCERSVVQIRRQHEVRGSIQN